MFVPIESPEETKEFEAAEAKGERQQKVQEPDGTPEPERVFELYNED